MYLIVLSATIRELNILFQPSHLRVSKYTSISISLVGLKRVIKQIGIIYLRGFYGFMKFDYYRLGNCKIIRKLSDNFNKDIRNLLFSIN